MITRIPLVVKMLVVGRRNYVDIKHTVDDELYTRIKLGIFYNCRYSLPFTLGIELFHNVIPWV